MIQYPHGPADTQTLGASGVQAVTINNSMTILEFTSLTAAATLNLTINSAVKDGAKLLIKVPATGLFDLTLGTGIDGPNVVGVAGKTKTQGFILRNGVFYPDGTAVQID